MNESRKLPIVLDCDEGRRLGCASFCCRLVVRLERGEIDPAGQARPGQSCVDKDPCDGLCVYFDRATGRCGQWERRPAVCRSYDCNRDPMLQVVLQRGFTSLLQMLRDYRELRPGPKAVVPYG